MTGYHKWIVTLAVVGCFAILNGKVVEHRLLAEEAALAESAGQADLDDAMRLKIHAEGLRDINRVIELLQSSLDKGLGVEDAEFAELMLSDALMERVSTLVQVINARSIHDARVQQIRRLVVSDLRRVLTYDDPPPIANFLLGRLLAMPGGDPHEARRVLTTFLEKEGVSEEQRAEALMLRARVQTDEAKALADFDAAIQLVPNNMNYRLARAMFLRSENKLEEALAETNQVLEQAPEDANALIFQGEVFRELGKLDEALASFDRATELAPQAPGPYQNRGEIYRDQGKFDLAVAQFTKVLELQPGVLLTLVHRAEANLRGGHLEEALADVEVVLEKQSGLIAAHRIRAEVLAAMNRLQEAIEEMERISEAMPNQPELKMQLALYYLVSGQPRRAIAAYSSVLERESDNFLALRSRGDAYLNIGEHAEAIADFERALKLEAKDPALLNNFAWVLATSPDDKIRNGQRAVELATKACELTHYKKPHILSTLAASFAESGDFKTAIKWSQQAVDMDDSDQHEQLAKELSSYHAGKPWREKQTAAEQEAPSPQEPPPTQADAPTQSFDF